MDKFIVLVDFTDLQDHRHVYRAGDVFPRDGKEVSEERIFELSTESNKRKEILIEKAPEDKIEELPLEEIQGRSVKDIKARLDFLEIEYKSRDPKDTLIDLLLGKGKEG